MKHSLKPESRVGEGQAFPGSPHLFDVARIWAYRERVEHEAADQFERMATGLVELKAEKNIVTLAQKAASDEKRHAVLCREIIAEFCPNVPLGVPQLGIALGPSHLDLRQRILYACVSLSCITETLSAALLIEMQKQAQPRCVRETVHSILEDEISHSRIGWAQLAAEANQGEVSWISAYVPAMLREAMREDLASTVAAQAKPADLSAWGILPSNEAKAIMLKTVQEVILPGLRVFGI